MTMSMNLTMRLEQRLKMTAQMIQSIQMLQLPLMQLQQEINMHLEENPTLEIIEEELERQPGDAETEERDLETEDDFEKLEVMAADEAWSDYFDGGNRSVKRFDGEFDAKIDAMQNTAAPERTLRDALLTQLHLAVEKSPLETFAEKIILSINDNGYLQHPLEEIFAPEATVHVAQEEGEPPAVRLGKVEPPDDERPGESLALPSVLQDLKQYEDGERIPPENANSADAAGTVEETGGNSPPVDMTEAREALELVQSFDPPGVGARDVEECLLLQLRRDSGDTAYERRLIEHHFDDLLNNRLPKVAKETGTSLDRVKEALEAIALLNPKPGALYDRNEQLRYILPDVIVEEVDGEYVVRLNDSSTPRLRISRNYMELMRAEKRGSATRDYIREKIQSAKWLIDAIEQRRNTLYKIAVQIVRIQRNFWEKGVSSLKPLMMQEVADRIGMHVSTVSRALADKWMQTPRGLFPMKYFFTGGFDAPDGSSQSNRSVKNRIQKMVDVEDKKTPLSDQEIASRLKVDGIEIARRTVAKYREKIGILSSRQRKEY